MTRSDRNYAEQSSDYLATRLQIVALSRKLESGEGIENNWHSDCITSEIAYLQRKRVIDC